MFQITLVQYIRTGQWTNTCCIRKAKSDVTAEFIDHEDIQWIAKTTDPLNPRQPTDNTLQVDKKATEHQHQNEYENAANIRHRYERRRREKSEDVSHLMMRIENPLDNLPNDPIVADMKKPTDEPKIPDMNMVTKKVKNWPGDRCKPVIK